MRLFLFLNLHFMVRKRLQTCLCLAGIALGVAVVVGIDAASQSALISFRRNVDVIAGKATHQVVAADGGDLDERLFPTVERLAGVSAAAPVVEDTLSIGERGSDLLPVLGIDPFLEAPFRVFTQRSPVRGETGNANDFLVSADKILISQPFADRHGLKAGDKLEALAGAKRAALTVAGLFRPDVEHGGGEALAVMDIASAQELFGKVGRLDRIDLLSPGFANGEGNRGLPPNVRIEPSTTRTAHVEAMVRSFQLNLFALSLLAVFVGAFLIYNTLTFSVIQRRRQIGIMRCVGMTRGQVGALFLTEALLMGLLGSLLGIGLGLLLTRYTLGAVAGTISTLFMPLGETSVSLSPLMVAKGVVVGVGASLAAALVPSYEASHVPPNAAMTHTEAEVKMQRWTPGFAAGGAVSLAVSLLLALWPTRNIALGLASAFALSIGFALLCPLISVLLVKLSTPLVQSVGGIIAVLGVRNIVGSLSRTGPAIAALMTALSMMVGVGLMVQSFRESLVEWIGYTIKADIYVAPAGRSAQRNISYLPEDVVKSLSGLPQVQTADYFRLIRTTVNGHIANLSSVEFDAVFSRARYRFLQGTQSEAHAALRSGDSVIISETLQAAIGLKLGDSIPITTPSGKIGFRIAGVYRDYSADGGTILMDRSAWLRHWKDPRVSSVALYLKPGVDAEKLVAELRGMFSSTVGLTIRSNAALRGEIISIFDSTFAITYVMQLLTLIVAVCGIMSALLALLLERTRELGTLRSVGMTRRQLTTMLFVESGAMGIIASLVGIGSGILLAAVLIYVVNVRSFGWTIQFHWFPGLFVLAIGLAVLAAFTATLHPMWRLRRMSLASALREE
ncbi:MAG: ABC transporter permease [Candidatus Sumerlaeaceae bacterium]|nr:ABC transporter permease [Candidatus Sumerlaeaceae bacterium]